MTIYLLRHGESEGNRDGLLSGVTDHGLTALGREQARAAGGQFLSHPFALIVTSALCRTQQTADLVIEAAGLKGYAREAHEEMNERHYGDLEGLKSPHQTAMPEDDPAWRASFEIGFRPRGGESMLDTHARSVAFLRNYLVPRSRQGDVLAIGHGNVLRSMTLDYLGWPVELLPALPSRNCLVTRIQPVPGA